MHLVRRTNNVLPHTTIACMHRHRTLRAAGPAARTNSALHHGVAAQVEFESKS
jgi:hypothetical protein